MSKTATGKQIYLGCLVSTDVPFLWQDSKHPSDEEGL